jgi:hypothetical protein
MGNMMMMMMMMMMSKMMYLDGTTVFELDADEWDTVALQTLEEYFASNIIAAHMHMRLVGNIAWPRGWVCNTITSAMLGHVICSVGIHR